MDFSCVHIEIILVIEKIYKHVQNISTIHLGRDCKNGKSLINGIPFHLNSVESIS